MAMTEKEFARIVRSLRASYRNFLEEEWEFREWYEEFRSVDFDVAMQAAKEMREIYAYPPPMAQYWARIKAVQSCRAEAAEAAAVEKEKLTPEQEQKAKNDKDSWFLFYRWCFEKRKFPKSHEEAMAMKAKFEKEEPDWEPEKEEPLKRGMSSMREILKRGKIKP